MAAPVAGAAPSSRGWGAAGHHRVRDQQPGAGARLDVDAAPGEAGGALLLHPQLRAGGAYAARLWCPHRREGAEACPAACPLTCAAATPPCPRWRPLRPAARTARARRPNEEAILSITGGTDFLVLARYMQARQRVRRCHALARRTGCLQSARAVAESSAGLGGCQPPLPCAGPVRAVP